MFESLHPLDNITRRPIFLGRVCPGDAQGTAQQPRGGNPQGFFLLATSLKRRFMVDFTGMHGGLECVPIFIDIVVVG